MLSAPTNNQPHSCVLADNPLQTCPDNRPAGAARVMRACWWLTPTTCVVVRVCFDGRREEEASATEGERERLGGIGRRGDLDGL